MPKDVFISYRSVQRTEVRELVADIQQAGDYNVWFDQEIIGGQSWWDEILKALQSADIVVLALSPEYLDSKPCQLEMDYAQRLGKAIVPVQISDVFDFDALGSKLVSKQIIQYNNNEKDTAGLKLALEAVQTGTPASNQDPPPIPLSLLATAQDFVDSLHSLAVEDQQKMVDDLRRYSRRNPQDRERVVSILQKLMGREDVAHQIHHEATEIVKMAENASLPPEQMTSGDAKSSSSKLTEPRAIIIAAVITATAAILAVVIGNMLNNPPDPTIDNSNNIAQEANDNNTTTDIPGVPAESGAFDITLIYGGEDSFTILANGESHLYGLTINLVETTEILTDSFPSLAAMGYIVDTGSCLRYIREETQPALPRGCEPSATFEIPLPDADVFWFDDQRNQFQDSALRQDDELIGLCPHAGGSGRCDFSIEE